MEILKHAPRKLSRLATYQYQCCDPDGIPLVTRSVNYVHKLATCWSGNIYRMCLKIMMTSSNGSIFRVTGINVWANNREAGDFKHHRAHYSVIVMIYIQFCCAYLCVVVILSVLNWVMRFIFPHASGLFHWDKAKAIIAIVPVKWLRKKWIK